MFRRSSFFRSCVHNKGRLPKFERKLSDQRARAMPVGHQGTRRLHVADKVLLLLFLFQNIIGRGRLIHIADVTVNVFLFTGSYSLILLL